MLTHKLLYIIDTYVIMEKSARWSGFSPFPLPSPPFPSPSLTSSHLLFSFPLLFLLWVLNLELSVL